MEDDKQEAELDLNFLMPTDSYYKSIRQVEVGAFEGIHLKSPEEIEAFLKEETDEEITSETTINNVDHSEEAQALEAYFMTREDSLKVSRELLDRYPDCIEAKLCLIGWVEDAETRIGQLEDLLEESEARFELTEAFRGTDKGRSFLRIKSVLGEEYLKEQYYDDGMELIEEVFEEDERDDFGVGFIIAVELAKKGKWPALNQFWNKFDAQVNIVTSVLRAISYFNIYGNKVKSKQALLQAYELDSTPFDVISGALSMEGMREEEYGDEEALFAVQILYDLMSKNEKLTRWIIVNIMKKNNA